MPNIKIVQILPYFPPHLGGLEIVAQEISKNLVKYHDLELYNLTSDVGQNKKGYHYFNENGYEVISIPSFDIVHHFPCPKIWTSSFWKAMNKIKTINPDIIQTHTRFFLQTLLGGIIAKILKKKWVHIEHGSGFVVGIIRWQRIFARLYDQIIGRLIFRFCDQVVSINQANIDFISKFTSKKKIKTIYNGIQIPDTPKPTERKNKGRVQMIYIGRLSPLKGLSLLIESCNQLIQKDIKNWNLDIIGEGELRSSLEADIQKYGLQNHISLLGTKSHNDVINYILPQSDIVVNPSYQEGLPTCVLEGLLSKCVVVATDVGGTSEISNHKDLILVDKGDVFSLQKGLEYAIQNIEKFKGLSHNEVKNRFSWKASVEKYYQVYKFFLNHNDK